MNGRSHFLHTLCPTWKALVPCWWQSIEVATTILATFSIWVLHNITKPLGTGETPRSRWNHASTKNNDTIKWIHVIKLLAYIVSWEDVCGKVEHIAVGCGHCQQCERHSVQSSWVCSLYSLFTLQTPVHKAVADVLFINHTLCRGVDNSLELGG